MVWRQFGVQLCWALGNPYTHGGAVLWATGDGASPFHKLQPCLDEYLKLPRHVFFYNLKGVNWLLLCLNHSTSFRFLGCLPAIMRPFGIVLLALMFPSLFLSFSGVQSLLTSKTELLGTYSLSNWCTCMLKYWYRHGKSNNRNRNERAKLSERFSISWFLSSPNWNENIVLGSCSLPDMRFWWDLCIIHFYCTKKNDIQCGAVSFIKQQNRMDSLFSINPSEKCSGALFFQG